MLLLDGTVLVHDAVQSDWWKLTPDSKGNYVTGTWSEIASMPTNYGPLYYASAVLPDGKLIVCGGEYNVDGNGEVADCAIYDPIANVWTSVNAPTGWTNIGDSQSVVFANGSFCIADLAATNNGMAILNESNLTWYEIPDTGKDDDMNEESWCLLPDRTLFTVDAWTPPNAQRYLPSNEQWISAGQSPQVLPDNGSKEMGPLVLGYDGNVFCFGADGNNGIYTPPTTLSGTGSWIEGPGFPIDNNVSPAAPYDVADGPACVLPNGNMLVFASPGVYNIDAAFFLWNGSTLTPVPGTPNAPNDSSYYGNMLILPNGQMLFTDTSSDIEVYTPAGGPKDAWRPTITNFPTTVDAGSSYVLTGTQLNGLTQGSYYGDDFQNATNYPIVRITNTVTGNVTYCRTGGHSTMAICTGTTPVTTNVAVPATLDSGPSTVEVIANGIPSTKTKIGVNGVNQYSLSTVTFSGNPIYSGYAATGTVNFTNTATKAATVALTCSNSQVSIPSSLNLAAGQTQVSFPINSAKVNTDGNVNFTATCNGVTVTGTVDIIFPAVLNSLTTPVSYVQAGGTAVITTVLDGPAPPSGAIVSLTSSNTTALKVPATMEVPSGAQSQGFYATASSSITATTPVKISATYKGTTETLLVYVTANGVARSVSLAPNPITCGAKITGTVTLEGPVSLVKGINVTLRSNNTSVGVPPSTVNIPQGSTSVNFTFATQAVITSTVITVTATAPLNSVTGSITVLPPVVSAFTAQSTTIKGGTDVSATVTINGSGPASGTIVKLTSSNPAVIVPASIVIPSSLRSTSFGVQTGVVTKTTTAVVTASLNGVSKQITFTVNP
jgi:hypothetical protein